VITLNAAAAFPAAGPPKGDREMSVPELRAVAAELMAKERSRTITVRDPQEVLHPVRLHHLRPDRPGARATNRRDGSLASFASALA
jgi:hypothetical protein